MHFHFESIKNFSTMSANRYDVAVARLAKLPDEQISKVCVQPLLQKYFDLRLTQITCVMSPSRPGERGVGHRY
jgi:hypothetical protein